MSDKNYEVWKGKALTESYLNGVRGAVPMAKEQFDVISRLIKMNKKGLNSFLDLGSGDGILSSVLLSQYPNAKGTLLDISEHMIAAAREKLRDYETNMDYIVYDYGDKDWITEVGEKAPYDVILSGLSIHHQPDRRKKQIYAEIYDLLSPGGLFINLEHVASPTAWVGSLFNDCFIDSLFEMHGRNNPGLTREKVAEELYNRPDKDANILAPLDKQLSWLKEIGFSDVDCYFKIFELAIFGGRK